MKAKLSPRGARHTNLVQLCVAGNLTPPQAAMLTHVLCAIDQGTTSTRVIVYDASTMQPVGMHQEEHQQIMPHPGCVLGA